MGPLSFCIEYYTAVKYSIDLLTTPHITMKSIFLTKRLREARTGGQREAGYTQPLIKHSALLSWFSGIQRGVNLFELS